jgi:ABC-type transport system involved in cytochrome c biogenesis permease subunit
MDSERTEEVYRWRLVALFGALATSLAAVLADRAPFAKDIQALMPVLRSNFWLGIHVLTITTSYAGAALAWMIGNVALGLYAFGRYRAAGADRSLTTAVQSNAPRRPPAFCGTLATVNYLVLQVTVLLLAAGTILGGLWADVSWGRFWGWDPKEVGALIALLILMIALHGRRSGWPGDLTLAIGAICGFLGVIFAWYVVNFILAAGKHSYGGTEGGQVLWLAILGGCQLLLISLAIIRSVLESGRNA